jgi:glycine/D-amino acid oxidase-like deaminating enzyme
MSARTIELDAFIIGGGIAGLWLLAELKARGHSTLLAEQTALGHGQTIASQGIIHGGTKYALTGSVSKATLAIGEMPTIWKNALNGKGMVDLNHVQWLTSNQLLWTSPNIASKMTGFFASKVMQSRMQAVDKKNFPDLFLHSSFKGKLYQLDEPVLDVPSLLNAFQDQFSDELLHSQSTTLKKVDGRYQAHVISADQQSLIIKAKHIFVTAGKGNENFIQQLKEAPNGEVTIKQQCRPLQMILAKGALPLVYAHGLGISDKPRITITSHKDKNGEVIWYIGGEPAERSVGLDPMTAIRQTEDLIKELLPWIDTHALLWSTHYVDRAEGEQTDGKRPNTPIYRTLSNVTISWPTKLAFAPMLAHELMKIYRHAQTNEQASTESVDELKNLPTPPLATPIWNNCKWLKPDQLRKL